MAQQHSSLRRAATFAPALFLAALAAHGQAVPVGGTLVIRAPVLDPPGGTYFQFEPHVAAAPDGGWAVFWPSFFSHGDGSSLRSRMTGRPVSPAGIVGNLTVIEQVISSDGPSGPVTATLDGTDWWVGWTNLLQVGSVARTRRLAADGTLGPPASHGDDTPGVFTGYCPVTLPLVEGWRLVAWEALSLDLGRSWIEAQVYDAAGVEVGERLRLGEDTTTARDPGGRCPRGFVHPNGLRAIAWPAANRRDLGVTEFSATGEIVFEVVGDRGIGQPFELTRRGSGRRFFALVGAVPGANPPVLRRSEVDEAGIGRIVAEAPIPAPRGAVLTAVRVDDLGNVAAVWHPGDRADVAFLGLWNAELVPQGTPVGLPGRDASVGFGGDGDLLAAWLLPQALPQASGHRVQGLRAQRFRVQRDADACIFRRNLFQCDTAGNGGAFEAQHRLAIGLAAGDQPLLADVDGDGRKDPCVFRAGNPAARPVLLCDPKHDGRFGSIPLPFDVSSGTRIAFGHLDGDGREDFCYFGVPSWSCVRSTGLPLAVTFGRSNWQPLLADFDGDGIDNVCEYLDGRFACDLGNDGGPADFRVNLPRSVLPGPAPTLGLAGDLDGDGRDEACVWAAGQLVCGSAPATGGLAGTIRSRQLGAAADTPLLGDLDHF
jgi:hypothetical protein